MRVEELLLTCCGFADDGETLRLFLDSPRPQARRRRAGVRTALFRLLAGDEAEAVRRYLAAHPAWEALRVPAE